MAKRKENPYEDGDDAKFVPVHKGHKRLRVAQALKGRAKGKTSKKGNKAVKKVILK